MEKIRHHRTPVQIVQLVLMYLFVSVGAFVCLYPLIFTVMAGFFSYEEFAAGLTGMSLFPIADSPTFENFLAIFDGGSEVSVAFLNSLLRTAYMTVCSLITSFIPGYVFARLNFRGRNALFMFLLATVMLPSTITLIPTYIMYARWPFAGGNFIFTGGQGILDTFWIYIVGGPVINVMGTFIVMQSFDKIPREMDEAAKIDGAGTAALLWHVLLPMQVPILTYVMVTTAISVWNDWMTPFYFTTSPELATLPGAITKLSSKMNGYLVPNYPLMITLGLAITIPCLIIFFFFQRFIVEGLSNAGLKD